MSDAIDQWDREWGVILARCYGAVDFRREFKAGLLDELRDKLAEKTAVPENPGTDGDWRRFLKTAYVPCRPAPEFKASLWKALLARQRQLAAAGEGEVDAVEAALRGAYAPVLPRREFATRLLANLKERQRDMSYRRRSSLQSGLLYLASGFAAAAMLMLALNLPALRSAAPPASEFGADLASVPLPEPVPPPTAGNALQVDDLFRQSPLPGSVRGLGIEMRDGGGWLAMNPAQMVSVRPGMSFRPVSTAGEAAEPAGLDFAGGSAISMRGDAMLTASDAGFQLQRGVMSVNVPDDAPDGLRLHFPERDIAVRPGTFLAVSAGAADQYAEGGAPAPKVTIADGGMAIARGENGSGALFANHVYSIDRYVSPDLPGRSLCNIECEELEKSRPASLSGQPGRLASLGGQGGRPAAGRRPPADYAARPPYGFSKRDSRWVADSFKGQPTLRIKYLSDAYFGLADSRRDLAAALALGPDVVIDGGDGGFYEIYP
ncbi:MAG: hypothetical protein LBU23_01125 [Planctomycetota bacterium]|jgi:hypothetical protein|nr:hypothetical protein [Planctomycetota bacterium]